MLRRTMVPWQSLGGNWLDRVEMATLLMEQDVESDLPSIHATNRAEGKARGKCHTQTVLERIQSATVLDIAPGQLDWSRLILAVPTEDVSNDKLSSQDNALQQLDLNSGGKVFFCLFEIKPLAEAETDHHQAAACINSPQKSLSDAPPTAHQDNPLPSSPFLSSVHPGPFSAVRKPPLLLSTSSSPPGQASHLRRQGKSMNHHHSTEGVVVLKFCGSRLLAQAEQLAGELARHCGVAAPESRVMHQSGATATEWKALEAAAERLAQLSVPALDPQQAGTRGEEGAGGDALHPPASPPSSSPRHSAGGLELQEELKRVPAALLMSMVPGSRFATSANPGFTEDEVVKLMEQLGRLFVLDMVLGNADRLACNDLGWRGNTGNLLLGNPGSRYAGKAVAIDACVQRRPPASKLDREDGAVDRLAQLVLTDPAGQVVLPLLQQQLLAPGPDWLLTALSNKSTGCKAVAAFQTGMSFCLELVVGLKGLFEMVHAHIQEWVTEFISDIKHTAPNLPLHSPSPRGGPRRSPAHRSHSHSGTPSPAFMPDLRPRRNASSRINPPSPLEANSIKPTKEEPGQEEAASSGAAVSPPWFTPSPGARRLTADGSLMRLPPTDLPPLPPLRANLGAPPTPKGWSPRTSTGGVTSASAIFSLPSPPPRTPTSALTAPDAALATPTLLSRSQASATDLPPPSPDITSTGSITQPLLDQAAASVSTPASAAAPGIAKRQSSASGAAGLPPAAPPPVVRSPNELRRLSGGAESAPAALPPPAPPRPRPVSTAGAADDTSSITTPCSKETSAPAATTVQGSTADTGTDVSFLTPTPAAKQLHSAPDACRTPPPLPSSTSQAPASADSSQIECVTHTPSTPSTQAAGPLSKVLSKRHARRRSSSGSGYPGSRVSGEAGSARSGQPTPSSDGLPPSAQRFKLPRELSLTRALKVVGQDARSNSELSERVEEWRKVFREHATALRTAADEWQQRHGFERILTMGFLSGAQPIVDLYELKVRLDHMLRRMRVLEEAAAARAPIRILDDLPLYLGNAVVADSHHVLKHLGISHILNATEEVMPPPESAGFKVLKLPLRDVDDEDITQRFNTASDFIDMALGQVPPEATTPTRAVSQTEPSQSSPQVASTTTPASVHASATSTPATAADPAGSPWPAAHTSAGPSPRASRQASGVLGAQGASRPTGILVHCSEGISRSVSLVAAYLVQRRSMRLAEAMTLIRFRQPKAAPNPGFGAALIALERSVWGDSSVEGATGKAAQVAKDVLKAKKSKPEPARCPVCGMAVGLSTASLKVHVRSKHPDFPLADLPV